MDTIAGSWEDIFDRAVDAAERGDAGETDALFDRLITRLNKLPDRVLMAGDAYLVGLRDRAVARYASYLLNADRAEEALALVDRADHKQVDIDDRGWRVLRAEMLSAAGRMAEAEDAWVGMTADADEPEEFEQSIAALIRIKRFASAAMLIRSLERLVKEEGIEDDYLPLSYFHCLLYASINRPAETERALQRLLKENDGAIDLVDEFFEMAWNAGFAPADLLRLSEVKGLPKKPPLHILFWRAFALQQMGRKEDAERAWRQIATDTVLHEIETKVGLIWIWSVAQYFLGDPKSMGLAATLDALREWGEAAPYVTYAAAAIGWALQGDETATNVNLALAEQSARATVQRSRLIPQPWREIAQTLLPPETFAEIQHHFAEREIVENQDLTL